MPMIIEQLGDLRAQLRADAADKRAVVMTMGALHAGHISLIETARKLVGDAGEVMVTIFVNPLQFAANEDLDKYPRTFEDDVALCEAAGVDVIFAPTPELMYPGGDFGITIEPGPLGARYEGAARPTHFAGVLTVVAKLINLTEPDFAVFGEKDYQQLTLISRMARALNLPVEIVGSQTIREPDGLALSSRNRYLDAAGRQAASEISTAIELAQGVARAGGSATEIAAAATEKLAAVNGLAIDYVAVTSADMDDPPAAGAARILIAANVGTTRLLDNAEVVIANGG